VRSLLQGIHLMGNTIDISISSLAHKETGAVRDDLNSTLSSLQKSEEAHGLMADIIIKLHGTQIRSDLGLDATTKITETHLYQWSKL
jgi:hypothetical protein